MILASLASPGYALHPPDAQSVEHQESQPDLPSDSKAPPQPSLDDLLEIEPDPEQTEPGGNDAAERDREEELKRQLTERQIADNFTLAIEKMSISAELLDVKFDPGLGTQRVQEEIIARLEQLIDQAGKRRMQMSSQSQSQQREQQRGNPMQPQPQQQQGDQRNEGAADGSVERDPPPMQQGDVNTMMEETRSEWGNLPQRVRDMLMQGRRDKPSSLYQQLTEEYYKRLAEEDSP